MSHQICLKWNNHMTMINDFKNYLLTQTMVDVTLACDGKSLKAHKLVLSACSPFFQTLFKENPCKHPIVILQGMKYAELRAIIDFIYDGEVNVTEDRLEDLIKAAETLRVKVLGDVMIASDESENQFGEGPKMQTDDEFQKQSSEVTEIQFNEGTENQFNERIENQFGEGMGNHFDEGMKNQFDEGMENQFDESMENHFDEGMKNQFDEGMENHFDKRMEKLSNEGMEIQTNEGMEKQSNEGMEKQSNEGMEKQSNEGGEKQSNEGGEKQSNEGGEKQSNEGREKQSNEGVEKLPDNGPEKKSSNVFENQFSDILESHVSENPPTDILENQCVDKSENQPGDGLSHQPVSSNDKPLIKKKRGRPRKLVKFQNDDGASKARNKKVDDVDIEELRTEEEFHDVNSSASAVPSPFHCANSSHISNQNELEKNNNESVILEDSFENATLNNLIAEQTLTVDDSPKKQPLQSRSKAKCHEKSFPDRPLKFVPIPSLPDSFVVLRDVMKLIHPSQLSKTPSASCKKTPTKKKLKQIPRKIMSLRYEAKNSDGSPSRKILKEKIENTGISARWVRFFTCKKCSFKTRYSESLKRHIISKHEKTRKFKCELCNYAASLKQTLKRHTTEVHNNVLRFQCSLCPYKSAQQANIKRHFVIVHEGLKPFQCEQCDFRSAQKSHIKKHVMAIHEQRRDFTCDFCTYRCSSKENLKRHYRLLHKITSNLIRIN